MGTRRIPQLLAMAALASVALVAVPPTSALRTRAAAAAPRSAVVATLRPGNAAFWQGQYLRRGSKSYSYRLSIRGQAKQLRVAIDVPQRTDEYRVIAFDPVGKRAAATFKGYGYSAELRVPDPRPGMWRIETSAKRVSDSIFRMRAYLAKNARTKEGPLLPDLRAIAPFDFTFSAPDDGAGSDYDNDPGDGYPPAPISCAPDETTENQVFRCLRFSAGIENSGIGPLDLRFDTADPEERMVQVIHHGNGSTKKRPAGSFEYHDTHSHFHYKNVWRFSLFEVTDPDKGRLELISRGRKSGFCPADQKIADWRSFYQDEAYELRSDCGMRYEEDPSGEWAAVPKSGTGRMAFAAGWGDVYGWYRPGNHVDFGLQGDGTYVIRVSVDGDGKLKESGEGNNLAYALVEVRGERVRVIERGRGRDPWDPKKTVIREWWRR